MAKFAVESEIAGTVWKIECKPGDTLAEEDTIMILESMKMEIPVLAPEDGTVVQILVEEGAAVTEGQELALMES